MSRRLFFLLLCWPALASAQRSEVWGVVTDRSGKPVAGAAVKLSNRPAHRVRSFVTKANGEYRFRGLHPDMDYTVRAQKDGIRTKVHWLSHFESKELVRVDIQLAVAE